MHSLLKHGSCLGKGNIHYCEINKGITSLFMSRYKQRPTSRMGNHLTYSSSKAKRSLTSILLFLLAKIKYGDIPSEGGTILETSKLFVPFIFVFYCDLHSFYGYTNRWYRAQPPLRLLCSDVTLADRDCRVSYVSSYTRTFPMIAIGNPDGWCTMTSHGVNVQDGKWWPLIKLVVTS